MQRQDYQGVRTLLLILSDVQNGMRHVQSGYTKVLKIVEIIIHMDIGYQMRLPEVLLVFGVCSGPATSTTTSLPKEVEWECAQL